MKKILLLAAALLVPCCAAAAPARRAARKAKPVPPQALQAAEKANAFAFRLNARAQETAGNVFFSPYSMYAAFGMVYEGARGGTAEELGRVFGFQADTATERGEAWLLRRELAAAAKGSEFGQANAVWYQIGYGFLPEYEGALKKYYGASAEMTNFRTAPDRAAAGINAWAAKWTGGRVPALFAPGSITALTRLVLANAVYFKGKWALPFDKQATAEGDFTLADGASVKAATMYTGGPVKAAYYEDSDLQAAALPYAGGTLRLLALLPLQGGAAELGRALTPERLAAVRAGLKVPREKVEVYLPAFRFGSSWDLNPLLSGLGMPRAFAPGADLSGMDGTKNLYLQAAVQKAFVEVNEEGAEAAAVTAVAATPGAAARSPKPKVFRADRPFLFLIEDARTGLILFMGRVSDPRAAG